MIAFLMAALDMMVMIKIMSKEIMDDDDVCCLLFELTSTSWPIAGSLLTLPSTFPPGREKPWKEVLKFLKSIILRHCWTQFLSDIQNHLIAGLGFGFRSPTSSSSWQCCFDRTARFVKWMKSPSTRYTHSLTHAHEIPRHTPLQTGEIDEIFLNTHFSSHILL